MRSGSQDCRTRRAKPRGGHRVVSLLAAVALLLGAQGRAAAQVPTITSMPVGVSAKNDVSPPLRDIPFVPSKPGPTIREMGRPGGEEEEESRILSRGPNVKPGVESVLQTSFGSGPVPLMPSTIVNFEGTGNVDGVLPPDTNGDVGPNHYVQMVNSQLQVFNKSGTSLLGPEPISTLWSGFGGPCSTSNDGDPIVLYDPMANRWLISQFTATNPFGECIAISTGPDPTGSYNRYFFQFSTTVFYDYPHLGVWPDGYYMAANRFNDASGSFLGASAIAFDRAKMLAGQTATFKEFQTDSTHGALLPSDLDGATLPPAGAKNTFVEMFDTSTLDVFQFHVDWTTPSNSTFSAPTSLAVTSFTQLCPNSRGCVDQPSTTVNLDGLGDRLMHRLAYRNFGDHDAVVLNHVVDAGSGKAAVRWYEIRSPGTTPTVFQSGTYSPDGSSRWMGSIAMDHDGNMALGYSVSSSTVFPSIRYTGRLVSDAAGQMPQGETTLIAGGGAQTHTASRWGDYAMMAVDPVDDCTFWFTTEYIPTTGSAPWHTRIGSFKFPGCGGGATATPTPVPPTATNTATRTQTPTAGPPTNTFTPAPPTNTRTNTPVPPTATPTATPGPGGTFCNNTSLAIPDNSTTGVTNTISVASGGSITDLNVSLMVTHTWVGDLAFTVTSPLGTSVTIVDRPGVPASSFGCSGDNINATLDDQASSLAENACNSTAPALSGSLKPNNPLSAFIGQSSVGTWTLRAQDLASGDTGSVTQWCVATTTGGTSPTNTPTSPAPTNTPTRTITPAPTNTSVPATATRTNTPVPPTATPTSPAATATPTSPAATATPTAAASLCRSPNLAIPDNTTTGVTDTMTLASGTSIGDLNVYLKANHTWVGDLVFTLRHVDTGKSVTIIDRPGVPASSFGCSGDNIDATLDDEATSTAEAACNSTSPALLGSLKPNNLLSLFDGDNIGGSWTLNASDRAGADTGTLVQWCLAPSAGAGPVAVSVPPEAATATPTPIRTDTLLVGQLVALGETRLHPVAVPSYAKDVRFGWQLSGLSGPDCRLSLDITDPTGAARGRFAFAQTHGDATYSGPPGIWTLAVRLEGCKQALYRIDVSVEQSVPAVDGVVQLGLVLVALLLAPVSLRLAGRIGRRTKARSS
jgi:subtilisin-like proprotein convertase family protein